MMYFWLKNYFFVYYSVNDIAIVRESLNASSRGVTHAPPSTCVLALPLRLWGLTPLNRRSARTRTVRAWHRSPVVARLLSLVFAQNISHPHIQEINDLV